MNIAYPEEIMNVFAAPRHVYNNEEFNIMGYAGDINIGEYVHLYFQVNKEPQYANSKIVTARFSAIGDVALIAAAEQFCTLVQGLTFQDAIYFCNNETGLAKMMCIPEGKLYSANFVFNAFYKALETLAVS